MSNINPSAQKIAKGAGILIIGVIISKLLAFIYKIIVARTSVEQYGILSLAIAVLGILFTISLLGLDIGVVRYVSFYRARHDTNKIKGILLFSGLLVLIISLILSILLYFFSDFIATFFFHNDRLISVLKLTSIAIPIAALTSISLSAIRAFQQVQYEVYSKNLIENILKIILTGLFILLGFKELGLVIAYILALLSTLALSFYFLIKKVLPGLIKMKPRFINNKELFFYSFPLLLVNLFASFIFWIDSFMLGFFKDVTTIGIYNAAQPIAHLIFTFPFALIILFTPVATELYSLNRKKEFFSVFKTTTKWIFISNLPILFILILLSKQILRILFGSEYIRGSNVLIILALSYFIFYLMICSNHVLMIYKKTKLLALNSILSAIINIILNFLLIPKYGLDGAAIATGISFATFGLLYGSEAYILTKTFPFKASYLKIILSIIIPILFIINAKSLFNLNNPLLLILLIFFFLLLYFVSLILINAFEQEDLALINLIKEKTKLKLHFITKLIPNLSKKS